MLAGIKYVVYDWPDVERDVKRLASWAKSPPPTLIVGILRGAATPTILLSDLLGVRQVRFIGIRHYVGIYETKRVEIYQPLPETSLAGQEVLLVDDVADTGKSLATAKHVIDKLRPTSLRIVTLHVKPWTRFRPDYWAREWDAWISYPWSLAEFTHDLLLKLVKKHELEVAKQMIAKRLKISEELIDRAAELIK
jgi:hypothetical protein